MLSRLFSRGPARPIPLESVQIHDVETSSDRRARCLKHLLKANFANNSVMYHNLVFHNHAPHILGSAYLLGASTDHLTKIYEDEARQLEPWRDSPGEISKHDWRSYLGDKTYQRAYVDFFEDELVEFGYDWKRLLHHYMFEGEKPLANCLASGVAHSIIHLGYAYELNSRTVAIEALTLNAVNYHPLHKYLDEPKYTFPAPFTSKSPLDLLRRLCKDDRLNKTQGTRNPYTQPEESSNLDESDSADLLLATHEDIMLEYWNALDISSDPRARFEDVQRAAVACAVATKEPGEKFDFFLLHILTGCHAARIVLPMVPDEFQVSVVRSWWLLCLLAYGGQSRPDIDVGRILGVEVKGRRWKDVDHMALKSKFSVDAHYVKGLRAMKNAAETWDDADQFFLKAALKLGSEFTGWGGFEKRLS